MSAAFHLSITMMTHPIREERARSVLAALDSHLEIKVSSDVNSLGIWSNAMNAWRMHDPDATHHMVIQDDIIPSKDLISVVPRLIEIVESWHPQATISFCDNLPLVMSIADSYGLPWVATEMVRHAQALIQPVSQIEDFISWSEWNVRPEFYHDDGRLELYLREHGKLCFHTLPSLVEHEDTGSIKSTLRNKNKKTPAYKAYRFIGEDRSGNEIDWHYGYKYFPTQPNKFHDWAIGKYQVFPAHIPNYKSNPVMHFPTSEMPYDEVMRSARISRGLITEDNNDN